MVLIFKKFMVNEFGSPLNRKQTRVENVYLLFLMLISASLASPAAAAEELDL